MELTNELIEKIENSATLEEKKELFKQAGIELADDDLEAIAGGRGREQRGASIKCPICNADIPVSMQTLLYTKTVSCPYCGLRLDLDKHLSARALEALRSIEEAEKKLRDK